MKKSCQLAVALAVLACVVIAGLLSPVQGQQRPREDVLDALLVEVRGLRGAIEQMASASARVQLVTTRLQLQEQRINSLAPRTSELRDRLTSAERELASAQSELRAVNRRRGRQTRASERGWSSSRRR